MNASSRPFWNARKPDHVARFDAAASRGAFVIRLDSSDSRTTALFGPRGKAREKNSRTPTEPATLTGLKLFIVHSHYRPGGVRRVIELAAPAVAATLHPRVRKIVLIGGEAPENGWLKTFRAVLAEVRVTCAIEPALGYISEQRARPQAIASRVRTHLQKCFAGARRGDCLVWIHNPGLGRNLIVADELKKICGARDLPMLFHHHDWWFDNRWARWPEMQRMGFATLERVAEAILPTCASVRHAGINQADVRVLRRHLGARAGWVPNPAIPAILPERELAVRARDWLRKKVEDDGPVWLVPCRLLRRKNLAEALLLTRWLRPEAWMVTTGALSSADEAKYASALEQASRRHGWRLRLSVLARAESRKPSVAALLAASEAILLTSLQEGFGLPSLEAAAAQRPLISRALPTIAPDLARFGFDFPQSYDDVQVDPRLFDLDREMQRQAKRWLKWRSQLPKPCQALVEKPALAADDKVPRAIPFSRLTLAAQLEVLAHPAEFSWKMCAPLNSFLRTWRRRAAAGTLIASKWPRRAKTWLGGAAYGRHVTELLAADPRSPDGTMESVAAMDEFIRSKLARENQYPLLWTSDP
jgi:glycosyltransferase involved in cell wall biosynthesis